MKVYASADIEGIAGIAHWDEANREHPDWPRFRGRMTEHVKAACEGAVDGEIALAYLSASLHERRDCSTARIEPAIDALLDVRQPAPSVIEVAPQA